MPDADLVIPDVACTLCGCTCDDIGVHVAGDRVVEAERACELARPWFLKQNEAAPPACEIEGRPVPYQAAIARAAEILRNADAPLLYGLSRSSTPGQRAAIALADRLGAVVDTTASRRHAASIMALQRVGESTCSLGEAKSRCDLVIYWGSNPVDTHPRHLERYSVDASGAFLNGRKRTLVVVDVKETPTSRRADLFLKIDRGKDFEALWALRALVAGRTLPPGFDVGAPQAQLVSLAERMKSCGSGIVFFGHGLALGSTQRAATHISGTGVASVEALLLLVTELNQHVRFYARRMRVLGDVAGADSVLCWQTGFPFSVSLNRGYPRYSPGEFSASELLQRSETDAVLFVGSAGAADLHPAARETLQEIPTIALDPPFQDHAAFRPTVLIRTAVYGVHAPGTAYRMDEVPIPLKAFLTTTLPRDEDVLIDLLRSIDREDEKSPLSAGGTEA
ncbi:MAG TPA: formylmethanofuran dehydrogenase subunit B [Pirellulaceae bacterium]|jgi:formylmethanofuran dehydrogenase subunit B|nr:formylmethanofuran dehydrogenase subunit B [Pirellulaceae bacterium]